MAITHHHHKTRTIVNTKRSTCLPVVYFQNCENIAIKLIVLYLKILWMLTVCIPALWEKGFYDSKHWKIHTQKKTIHGTFYVLSILWTKGETKISMLK